jgi:16S rRNA (adenine1518-N6/adenine1519-N6)-dimethyltransferase
MDPALIPEPLNIPALLRQYQLRPRKSLGQNFLIDNHALEKVVAAAEISKSDHVLEIGAGLGSLTRFLARAANQVIAVELDVHLMPLLKIVLQPEQNVELVFGDILDLDPSQLMSRDGYLVVANIPYYITSAIIRHLLEAPRKPRRMVLTIQKEVAQRICAAPGDLSLLALSVQVFGEAKIAAGISAAAFYPPPKVDSSVIKIDLYNQPVIPAGRLDYFFKLAKAGFSQKRKMLRNSLAGGLGWPVNQTQNLLLTCEIDPTRRAETISLAEWNRITAVFLDASQEIFQE